MERRSFIKTGAMALAATGLSLDLLAEKRIKKFGC